VRAVAAEALLPVATLLAGQEGKPVQQIRQALWDNLLDVDDLSPSSGMLLFGMRFSWDSGL